MPPKSLPHQPAAFVPHKSQGKALLSRGVLAVEAAIATLVLSLFVSSNPRLFATQPFPSRPATAINPDQLHTPHNHAPAAHAIVDQAIQQWERFVRIHPQTYRP